MKMAGEGGTWVWTYITQQAAAGGSCKRVEVTGTGQEASMRAPERPLPQEESQEWLEGQSSAKGAQVSTTSCPQSTSLSSFSDHEAE